MMTPSERDKGPGSHDANGIIIREAVDSDLEAVLQIERAAFGSDEEADLVEDLLGDASARPLLSLIALMDKEPSGHILFTHASLDPDTGLKAALLAPLAVTPEHQKKGIGGSLIREGLKRLQASGTDLVFVLGHPGYYPRHGFTPAGKEGFDAPYPIPEKDADAWMVMFLQQKTKKTTPGKLVCADALMRPELWLE